MKKLLTLMVLLLCAVTSSWADDIVWQSDMQESITGVTQTKGRTNDSWSTNLSLAWASGYTKGFQCGGSSSTLTLAFDTPLSLKTGNTFRIYVGATGARDVKLFLNSESTEAKKITTVQNTVSVLEYELPSNLTLNSFKLTTTNSGVYFFKAIIIGDKPSVGETTLSYLFTYKSDVTQGFSNNCISTLSGFSSKVAVSTVAIGSNNGADGCTGQITGQAATESADSYVDVQFTVADGYKFTPTLTSFAWRSIANTLKAKVAIMDATTTVTSNESTSSGSNSTNDAFTFESGAFDGKAFTGTVHIRVYTYGVTGKRAWLVSPFTLTGTVALASSDPTLSVEETPTTFTYDLNETTGPSAEQTFTVSLANSEETISATLSNKTDYEMKTGEGDWGTAALTTLSSGDAVQVRLKSGLSVGEHNGKLTFTSDGAENLELDLTGSVTNTVAINLAWDKSSDIVATNSVVTAPVFSNNGGLEVNTTNFNFAITGTEGIISVADNGIVTINSSVKGVATVTASVKASGYSADPVAYTIRVADAATKWDFTTVEGTVDEYNLSADAAGDGILWTYDSGNKRYKNKYDSENHTDLIPTANSNYLTVAEGLLLSWNAADRFRIDIKYNRAWANGGAVIKITNLKAGQKVSVSHKASGEKNYPRGFETSNLSNTSEFSLNDTDDHTATGYVTADGTVTLTAQGGGTYLYTITVEDYVPVTVTSAKYATFASDSKLDFTGVTGLSAYTATAKGTTITFNQVTGSVPTGEGLLLYADVNENTTYYVPVATGSTSPVDNLLKRGTGASLTYGDGAEYYILSNESAGVGFYKANGNVVSENKAYLDLTGTNAKSFALPGSETTGIRSIENGELRIENSNYYNLAGQRVGKDYKGIVIVNGKKMLNK